MDALLAALLIVVLALHLLCVNVAAGGPLVCLWLDWREGRGDAIAGRLGRWLAGAVAALIPAGAALGLMVGLLLWSPTYGQAVERLSPKIYAAVGELLFSLVLLTVYYLWWKRRSLANRWERGVRMLLPLLAGTNLLYHFPLLFVVLAEQSAAGGGEVIDNAAFRRHILDGEVLSRAVHFVLAAFAGTGAALVFYAWRTMREDGAPGGNENAEARRAAVWGGRIALAPTLLQIPVGFWLLMELDRSAQRSLMGSDLFGTTMLLASLAAAFALMHHLGALTAGRVEPRTMRRTLVLLALVVVMMTGVLQRVRNAPSVEDFPASSLSTRADTR